MSLLCKKLLTNKIYKYITAYISVSLTTKPTSLHTAVILQEIIGKLFQICIPCLVIIPEERIKL